MEKIATVGLDLAKSVFQLHGVDDQGRIMFRALRRSRDDLSSGNNEIVSIPRLTHRRHDSFVDWVDGYVRKRADARRFSI
jgi:hypothetical protein